MVDEKRLTLMKVIAWVLALGHSFYRAIIEIMWGIASFLFLGILLLQAKTSGVGINIGDMPATFMNLSRYVSDYWEYWFIFMMVYFFLRDKGDLLNGVKI